ncbi:hypothetical protein AHiyo1_39510 [Arthrobacter sp. Hiyo1]|nr:hypothetical protein AHiyo1_39510 [Arthrobacter sp. Hiyo1]
MRFHCDVLDPLGLVGVLVDEVGRRESGFDVPQLGMDLRHDVVLRAGNPCRFPVFLPMDRGRTRQQRVLWREDSVKEFIFHLMARAPASAAPTDSATTAATRWPMKRTTLSRTRVSSGSSV